MYTYIIHLTVNRGFKGIKKSPDYVPSCFVHQGSLWVKGSSALWRGPNKSVNSDWKMVTSDIYIYIYVSEVFEGTLALLLSLQALRKRKYLPVQAQSEKCSPDLSCVFCLWLEK